MTVVLVKCSRPTHVTAGGLKDNDRNTVFECVSARLRSVWQWLEDYDAIELVRVVRQLLVRVILTDDDGCFHFIPLYPATATPASNATIRTA